MPGAPTEIRRILLKISGESLASSGRGLDPEAVAGIAEQIAKVHTLGAQIAVVVGGGNLIRGATFAKMGTNRATADQMGMLATAINGLALMDALERTGIETRAMSAVELNEVMEPYIRRRAIRHLEKDRIVILAAGTGNPYFTTDTAAALRATELGVDAVLKATKVDGVYTADPKADPAATRIECATFREGLKQDLRVMDRTWCHALAGALGTTAEMLAREHTTLPLLRALRPSGDSLSHAAENDAKLLRLLEIALPDEGPRLCPLCVTEDLRLPLNFGALSPGFMRRSCAEPPASVARIAWG